MEDKQEGVRVSKPAPFVQSRRFLLAIIAFVGTVHLYGLRMNISVAILCMTNSTALQEMSNGSVQEGNVMKRCQSDVWSNETQKRQAFRDGQYAWDSQIRGVILGVFFWGYLVNQIPAGILSQKFGPKIIIAIFMALSALSTLIVPVGATVGPGFLAFLRVILGMGSAVWFPCMHHLWSHWAPPLERSKLVGFAFAGIHIGNVITLPLASLLCEYGFAGGWPSIFYIYGISTGLWVVLWIFFAYDTPSEHPRISEAERSYISDSLQGQITENEKKIKIPVFDLVRSLPFWALLVANITYDFGGYFFLTSIPLYMRDVLGFDITENGLLSALPYVGNWAGQMFFAFMGDLLQTKKLLNTTWTRKLMTSIGMFSPGVLVIVLGFLTCSSKYVAVVMLTIGLTLNGACFAGTFVNHVDLAPRYAGVMFAITNSIAAITGFFAPYVVGSVAISDKPRTLENTQKEWRSVFFICAANYFFGGIIFLIFGSGALQSWAVEAKSENANGNLHDLKDIEATESFLPNGTKKNEEAL